jgi:hypothetical protein
MMARRDELIKRFVQGSGKPVDIRITLRYRPNNYTNIPDHIMYEYRFHAPEAQWQGGNEWWQNR